MKSCKLVGSCEHQTFSETFRDIAEKAFCLDRCGVTKANCFDAFDGVEEFTDDTYVVTDCKHLRRYMDEYDNLISKL